MHKDDVLMQALIREANNNGFKVSDFNELSSIKRKIRSFIPILVKYLFAFEKDNVKDAIVGLLGVKGFYEATETLLELYYSKDVKVDKWSIGDALYFIEDKRFEDEYIKIVTDRSYGISRQMIVILLGKLKCERSIQTLVNLLTDEDVNGHAIIALGYFKHTALIESIEPFLHHEKKWIRKEAEKSINKIRG